MSEKVQREQPQNKVDAPLKVLKDNKVFLKMAGFFPCLAWSASLYPVYGRKAGVSGTPGKSLMNKCPVFYIIWILPKKKKKKVLKVDEL